MASKTQTVKSNLEEAVLRGAAWLDANHPNWWERIDLNMLNMINCYECVLGQLFGEFYRGVWNLPAKFGQSGRPVAAAEKLGFAVPDLYTVIELEPQYQILTKLWRAQINQRRGVPAGWSHV